MTDLARLLQVIKSFRHFFRLHEGIRSVKEETIQALDLQTFEDTVNGVQNIVLRKIKIGKAVFANPTLGLDPHLLPKIRTTLENLTKQDLTLAIAIDIRQVKGVDPNR